MQRNWEENKFWPLGSDVREPEVKPSKEERYIVQDLTLREYFSVMLPKVAITVVANGFIVTFSGRHNAKEVPNLQFVCTHITEVTELLQQHCDILDNHD